MPTDQLLLEQENQEPHLSIPQQHGIGQPSRWCPPS